MLETVAVHRESHVSAHAELAKLGELLSASFDGAKEAEEAKEAEAEEAAEAAEEAKEADAAEAEAAAAAAAAAEAAEAGVEAEAGAGWPLLGDEISLQLKKTLAAFSVPIEMSDVEVMRELLAGTSSEGAPVSLKRDMLRAINAMRVELLDESIQR